VVELRLLISVVMLGTWLALRKPQALRVEPRDWGSFLILGSLGVAVIQGGYYYSISKLGVGLAILIQYLAPTLIVLYEIARGARPDARVAVTVLAALAGTALLVGNVGAAAAGARPLDWAISFSTALTFAFYIVYSKRVLGRYAPETVLLYTFLVAGVLWAFVTPPARIISAGYPLTTWALFVLLAIVSALAPFSCFYAGLRRLSAAEAGIFATLEPVIAVLTAWIALGEGLSAMQWMGALLVLVAALLATMGWGLRVSAAARGRASEV
jgi:DME family drug/metabolite transporter